MSSPGQQVGFPQLDSHFVDEERNILYPWYRLLVALWQFTGSGTIPIFQYVFFKLISPGNIEAFDTTPGGVVGVLKLKDQAGAPEQVLAAAATPFYFNAPGDGFLTAASGMIRLKRTSIFYKVSLVGGAFPLTKNDVVEVSWTGDPPEVVWWPEG
jgi:hypothetical protein